MKTALYYIRTRCNYSQSMAAREIGVSRQMFSAWERGDKPIPDARKDAISALFGVPVSMLEETDEIKLLAFCDRPMFTTVCQGKQVFSFLPPENQARVFLGSPTETRPEERCRELMSQKTELLEQIDGLFRFAPQQQVDELPNMELKLSLLSCFSSVADAAEAVAPQYRGRLLPICAGADEDLIGHAAGDRAVGTGCLGTAAASSAALSLGADQCPS